MKNITYEQFVNWCNHWNYTVEEGHKAMCFASNIIGQHYGNCIEYANEVSKNDNHSDAFKRLVEMNKDDADLLLILYERLNNAVFDMLTKYENGTDI